MMRVNPLLRRASDWSGVAATLIAGLLLPIQLGARGTSAEAFLAYALAGGVLIACGQYAVDGEGEGALLVEDAVIQIVILLVFGGPAFALGRLLG